MKDALGDRMKEYYENRFRHKLVRRTYTIIRIDGKAFHTYTKGLERPFDADLMEDMDKTAIYLCKNIQGAKFAYVQSDEISILITDFDDIKTDLWFDGNVQKIASVSASLATFEFNRLRLARLISKVGVLHDYDLVSIKPAHFDSRVFQIPEAVEVENYFIFRQKDATRNSVSSVAQSLYSQKKLHGKNSSQMQDMIHEKGINWNDYTPREKRGGMIIKTHSGGHGENCLNYQTEVCSEVCDECKKPYRTHWVQDDCPIFTQEREYLSDLILGHPNG